MPVYRLYIDEVGNEGMTSAALQDDNNRYLSLTGVIIESDYYKDTFHPSLYSFKSKFIPGYPDDPQGETHCLHRRDIMKKQNGFEFLNDDTIHIAFDQELMKIVRTTEYTVISVVIDKLAHLNAYGTFYNHPYYYCLNILLERYVRFLETIRGTGDVLIEARGKNKDKELKRIFESTYQHGTGYIHARRFQQALSSQTIKIKPKEKDIYGLQLADIVAYPCYAGIKSQKFRNEMPVCWNKVIFEIINMTKFYRTGNKLWGIGKKWLP